jgi:hypothetical protein
MTVQTSENMVCIQHAPHLLPMGRRAIADLFYLSMFGKNETQVNLEMKRQDIKEAKKLRKLNLGLLPL